MTNETNPRPDDEHDEQSLEEAEEKMLLRDREHEGDTSEGESAADEEHDPEALAEAERKMLLREDRT